MQTRPWTMLLMMMAGWILRKNKYMSYMNYSLPILLSLLLLPVGCKESESTPPEKTEKQVKLEIKAEQPENIDVIDLPEPNTIDPNLFSLRIPLDKVDSPHRSGMIIRPDTSKDHKIIIIPGDPDIDPGIFDIGKQPAKKYGSSPQFIEPNDSNDIFLAP